MNGKKAKRLRREAREATVGASERRYYGGANGEVLLHSGTTRARLKHLKKQEKL